MNRLNNYFTNKYLSGFSHIMRKQFVFVLVVLLFTGLFTSCEKVIDLNLKTSSSQLVVQGNIYDEPGPYFINLTKSVDFDQPSVYPPVIGATVTISDNTGNSEVLREITPGNYSTSLLQGIPGRTYTLSIQTEGQTYTSISTMPAAVEIDSLYKESGLFPRAKQFGFKFSDPAGVDNYYRLVDFIGKIQQNKFMVGSDFGVDGKEVENMLLFQKDDIATGDTLTIWLEAIDKGVYNYFNTADNNRRDSSTPANPLSNVSNGALGYFNACAVRKKSIIVL